MATIPNMVGASKWNGIRVLVFKYLMNNSFVVNAFDASMTETTLETKPCENGMLLRSIMIL